MSDNFPVPGRDQIVEGVYRLGAVVHSSSEGSVYETEFGDDARPALIKITRDEITRGRDAVELNHPNLIRVYATGQSVVDDIPVSYIVVERADESLASVLAERPLSEAETREMLTQVLAALKHLHQNGYAHSNLKASNVFAVGDLVKLSIDTVTRVDEGGDPALDMWALGALIVNALRQQEAAIERETSQPFSDIVRHCMDPDSARRWTVDQVQTRLAPTPVPVSVPEHDEPRRTPKWIYAALAALLLIVLAVAFLRKSSGPPPVASPPLADQAVPLPTTSPTPPSSAAPLAHGRREAGWSVVVAAYRSRGPAENRSQKLARKWPGFKWSVIEEPAGKKNSLVVIGHNLSEDEAENLRNRALTSGLPRDTYIKKLE